MQHVHDASPHPTGYLLDVAYTANVFLEQAPLRLAHVATINDIIPPDLHQPFTLADLGCGRGRTLCTFAAALPHSDCYGIDFNPEHINDARDFATQCQLSNTTFLDASFGDPNTLATLPPLDIILLHGVYTWVAPDVREHIHTLLRERLKPGGLLFISYNAYPGAYALAPLRDIMRTYTANMTGSVLDRARQAMAYLSFMREHQAPFFDAFPYAARIVDLLKTLDLRYIAHEFFNEHWAPTTHTQLSHTLAEHDLAFVGSADIHFNYLDFVCPPVFLETLKGARDNRQQILHLDFIRNTAFRRDVFVKTPFKRFDNTLLARFAKTPIGTWHTQRALRKPNTYVPVNDETWHTPPFPALLNQLETQTHTPIALAQHTATPDVIQNLMMLIADQRVWPFLTATHPPTITRPTRYTLPSPFNRVMLNDAHLTTRDQRLIVAPRIGHAIAINFAEGMLLRALTEAGDAGAFDWAFQFATQHRHILTINGDSHPTDDAIATHLHQLLDEFYDARWAKMLELGVLEALP